MKISIYKKRALAPIISAILLLVVGVILVTIVLTWGKNFTTKNLDSATDFGALSASDASLFVFSKTFKEGVVMFTYSPPSYLMDEEITITHYRIVDIPEMTSVQLTTPVTLSASTNIVPLECLYEYSKSSADITIQFITTENKYIEVKTRDPNIVCTSGGTGTEEDPIIVCNAEDLNDIRTDLDANYALGKDIDLQCFSRQDVNGWEPIGAHLSEFTGSFDGQNHTISNLYINRPATNNVSLFGVLINSKLKNIGLININVLGSDGVGGLSGYVENSDINNCYSTGNVFGNSGAGGLIGKSLGPSGVISNCYSASAVSKMEQDSYSVGGLVGYSTNNIYNSYAIGDVSGDFEVGGLVGFFAEDIDANIVNCYSMGAILGTSAVGGLIGTENNLGDYNNYWDMNTSGQATSAGGIGKTTTEMKTQSTFSGWDFSSIWGMDSSTNSGYPYLRSNPPD